MIRKAKILFNPLSGERSRWFGARNANRHADAIAAALAVLRSAGVDASAAPTDGPGSAAHQVRQAIAEGCDAIFAAGGDGTVNDVLQGFADAPDAVALGVLPLGTANSLANDLGIPRDAATAARLALTARRRAVPVGEVRYHLPSGELSSRLFLVAFGAGLDAAVFHSLAGGIKRHLGEQAYYAVATWIWLTHHYDRFAVELTEPSGAVQSAVVTQALVTRITNFGGMLGQLVPGASIHSPTLRVVLFHTTSRLRYAQFLLSALLFKHGIPVPGIEVLDAQSLRCHALAPRPEILIETDGDLLGTLPAEVRMAARPVTLLLP